MNESRATIFGSGCRLAEGLDAGLAADAGRRDAGGVADDGGDPGGLGIDGPAYLTGIARVHLVQDLLETLALEQRRRVGKLRDVAAADEDEGDGSLRVELVEQSGRLRVRLVQGVAVDVSHFDHAERDVIALKGCPGQVVASDRVEAVGALLAVDLAEPAERAEAAQGLDERPAH